MLVFVLGVVAVVVVFASFGSELTWHVRTTLCLFLNCLVHAHCFVMSCATLNLSSPDHLNAFDNTTVLGWWMTEPMSRSEVPCRCNSHRVVKAGKSRELLLVSLMLYRVIVSSTDFCTCNGNECCRCMYIWPRRSCAGVPKLVIGEAHIVCPRTRNKSKWVLVVYRVLDAYSFKYE